MAYVQLGNELNSRGETTQAMQSFEHAYSINPYSDTATLMLSALKHNAGDLQESESLLRHAISLDDREPFVEVRLAEVLAEGKKFTEAEDLLRASIQRWPDAKGLNYELGMVLKSEGKSQQAQTAFEREHEISPNDAETIKELKH
jgi:predicted negative regulator of RcsB-dependent stress response